MQFPLQAKSPPGVVVVAEFGRGVDEALALGLIYGAEGKGDVRLAGVCTTRPDLDSAAFADVIARFLSAPIILPIPGAAPFRRPPIPIGMPESNQRTGAAKVSAAVLDLRGGDGQPAYTRHIQRFNDTADPIALLRNALTAFADGNCSIVLAGAATPLANLLDLPGATELIQHKLKYLVIAAGQYPSGGVDANIQADPAAAKKLLAKWPSPIVAVGSEVGAALPFPGASIETQFGWAPHHPIADAYRAFGRMPYDAPAPALAATLYAAYPDRYFQLSPPGQLSVTGEGGIRFSPEPGGQHRYLMVDPASKDKVLQAYVELVSAKPVPRRLRRTEKKDAEKADDKSEKKE